jgi:hypothetical protein
MNSHTGRLDSSDFTEDGDRFTEDKSSQASTVNFRKEKKVKWKRWTIPSTMRE